jgi:predicted small lipoprotein YifL
MKPFLSGLVVLPILLALCSCGGKGNRAVTPEDPQAAADQERRYQEMMAQAERKAREGRGEEKIQQAITEFLEQVGRVPTNLTELVSANILRELPKPPTGRSFYYAPEKGRVVLVNAPPPAPGAAPATGGDARTTVGPALP